MDRNRERRYEGDRSYGGGESYRPSDRDGPPARSNYRAYRSPPPRRERTPPRFQERHNDRRRSRSPLLQARNDVDYQRARSPPRRAFSPRRDERRDDRQRSPVRQRRPSRSPVRARSPLKYRREPSPSSGRYHSPPRSQRRAPSPHDRDTRRPYTPPREPRSRYPNQQEPYRRERSRSRPIRRSDHISRPQSPAISSRRSSPPMHPDRVAQAKPRPRSPPIREIRPPVTQRENGYKDDAGPRQPGYSPRARSPPRAPSHRSPPRREPTEPSLPSPRGKLSPPSQSSRPTRMDETRAPPSQPSAQAESAPREPPSGPASYRQMPPSGPARPSGNSILSAPTRPRGGASYRGDQREHSYGGAPSGRGGRTGPFPQPRTAYDAPTGPGDRVPSGPRSSSHANPYNSFDPSRPSFRPNNSSSATYPRTQRFTNHLASLPNVVPGGRALPPIDPAANKKLTQLEEEALKLRKQIDDRQRDKRTALREWETRERESRRENMRSEAAQAQLESFSGEVIGGQAF